MRILITGGSGFIGRNLTKRLLSKDIDVTIVDLKPPLDNRKVRFIQKSILEDLTQEMSGQDMVYHLAAELGVAHSDSNPLSTLIVNIDGTVNVFRSALSASVPKLVYTSSSEVYGEASEIPIRESTLRSPVSTYGVSKLAAEMYARAYVKEHDMDINPVRLFNVYGPGQRPEWVVPIFIQRVLQNQPPIVFGNGEQIRCYTYVDDVVDGLEAVRQHGMKGEPYNIGNPCRSTVKHLAELIIKLVGKDLEPVLAGFGEHSRERQREIMERVPSVDKLCRTGWEPKTSLEDGIRATISWTTRNRPI